MMYYSPSTRGFYDAAADRPEDCVEVAPARYRELFDAQALGVEIVPSETGTPVMDRPRTPSIGERRALLIERVKYHAQRRIDQVAPLWRQLNDLRGPGAEADARFAAIDAIRTASEAIEIEIAASDASALDALDIPNHPLWPESA